MITAIVRRVRTKIVTTTPVFEISEDVTGCPELFDEATLVDRREWALC